MPCTLSEMLKIKENVSTEACKLRLWTLSGKRRMQELLVEIGLPLAQSRQKFFAMDLIFRKEFCSNIEERSTNYNLNDVAFASFVLSNRYQKDYSASDVVYSLLSLLESTTRNKSVKDCFIDALNALSQVSPANATFLYGIEQSKLMLVEIYEMVRTVLDMRMVVSAGRFLCVTIQEGAQTTARFFHPYTLYMFAHFTLNAYVQTRKGKTVNLPLIASAPTDTDGSTCLLLGIPPVVEDSPKNFFGKAFEQAAERSNSRVQLDFFDTSIIKLKLEDRSNFLDALAALLW